MSAAHDDTKRLDWLNQNIFYRELDDWDRRISPDRNMWVMFAPKGHQGSARNIIDAAMNASDPTEEPSKPLRS